MASKLAIIAGGGELPARLVAACRKAGRACFVLALEGHADPAQIPNDVEQAWIRLGGAGRGLRLMREAGVEELVMAGPVRRPTLMELRPDWRTALFFAKVGLKALGDDGLLRAVIGELEQEGFRVVGVDSILDDLLASAGVWGTVRPDAQAEADIARGLEVLRSLGALDIGQAVVVQQGIVLGVEAVEGTAALIERCGGLRREGPGGVLVKIAKPGQERRADLPTVGVLTVRQARSAGLRGIAVEAGNTLVVQRQEMMTEAEAAGLFIVGVPQS
jgi:DUF1009 family protein